MFNERVMRLFDEKYHLYYVDYRENLNDYHKEVEEAIRERDWYPLDSLLQDWELESDWGGTEFQLKELKDRYIEEFECEPEEAQKWIEENREEIEDIIRARDVSNPLKDLLRQTGEFAAFYELPNWDGCGETWCMESEEFSRTLHVIRKALHIKRGMYKKELNELLSNSSYGGVLVVYFNPDIEEFIEGGDIIKFRNPNVALINTFYGSGHHVQLNGHEFEIDYESNRVFLDKNIKYNYTHKVCGMRAECWWGTGVSFRNKKVVKQQKKKHSQYKLSKIQADRNQDEQYAKTWNNGKGHCSFGDMDINRHKNVFYINNFPCGMKCKECGTFWID